MEICDFVIESGSFVRRIFKEFFPRGGGGGIFLVPFFLFFFLEDVFVFFPEKCFIRKKRCIFMSLRGSLKNFPGEESFCDNDSSLTTGNHSSLGK